MTIFDLVSFQRDRHVTVRMRRGGAGRRLFGDIAVSYVVEPLEGGARSRLVAKLVVRYTSGPLGAAMRWLLPWGDFVMMRKQLLTLKSLAERGGIAPAK
jgi:hypothetical protein